MAKEAARIQNDPNYVVEMAVGPAFPELVAQQPGTGLELGRKYSRDATRYVLKAAHMSKDDFRIFNDKGKLCMNMHHPGKNPVGSMDPLGLTNADDRAKYHTMGEWEAHCDVTGRHGFPSFKIRPKTFSRHGRQFVKSMNDDVWFNIAKQGKLHTMSMLPHYEVCRGDDDDAEVYIISGDLMARTMQIKNMNEELVALVQKSTKTLLLNAALGKGSEMMIDIAPGVDHTAILAVVMAMEQVGESYAKDAVNNFIMDPLKDGAVDSVLGQAGGAGSSATQLANKAVRLGRLFQS